MVLPELIVQSLKSVSSSPPSSLSFGLNHSLSYSSNDSVDFTLRKKNHYIKKELDERAANLTPTKFGDKTTIGPTVRGNRRADAYSRRLSKVLGQSVTPSPGSPRTKTRQNERHLQRTTYEQSKERAIKQIDERKMATQRSGRGRGGRIFKFKTKKQKNKKNKKTKIKKQKKTKITNKKTKNKKTKIKKQKTKKRK
jgi:hypothetical protein